MKIPKYADCRERTVSECSTLLTKAQTSQLLNMVVKEYGTAIQPYLKLRGILFEDGWSVVEKHGDRLFLRALITYGDTGKEEVDRFIAHAEATGNWSFSDWRNTPSKPPLKTIK